MNWGVNWQDGMKITAAHFLDERRSTAWLMYQYSKLFVRDNNYGKLNTDHDIPLYKIEGDTLYINRYEGVTQSGHFIYIGEEESAVIKGVRFSELEAKYSVDDVITIFLKLDLNQFEALGEPNADEMPYRQPYSMFKISIDYTSGANQLGEIGLPMAVPVLQMLRTQSGLIVNEAYIPPIAYIKADRKMTAWFYELVNLNFQIAALNSEIIQRLSSDTHTSYLKSSITILCTQMAFFMANNMDAFADELLHESPQTILSFYKKMGRVINASLVAMNNRERVIQYMADWTSSTPEVFLEKLDILNEMTYNHSDIRAFKLGLIQFTDLVLLMFRRLANLNFIE